MTGRSSTGRSSSGRSSSARSSSARSRGSSRRSGSGDAARAAEQVEGRQAVLELLKAGRRPVRRILLAAADRSGIVAEITARAGQAGVPVVVTGRAEIDAMAVTDAPQGVIGLAAPLPELDLQQVMAGAGVPFLVVLDGVTDPHNVGAVMRSALSAGATGLVLPRHRSGHLTPAAVKAAAGAAEHLPVATVAGIPAALAEMRSGGVWTVGIDAGAEGTVWDLTVADQPLALVLGAEGRGLAPLTRQRCELLAGIPMTGPLASLNVSAAAAVACFAVARLRSG